MAGVTITTLFGNNGIINKAEKAKNEWANAENIDKEGLDNLNKQMENYINGISGGSTPVEPPKNIDTIIATNDYVTENTKVTDKNGDGLTVPKDFKVTSDSNEVKKGVVIEDKEGNQFVWVPVSDPTTMYEIQGGQKVGKLYNFTTEGSTARTYPGKNTGFREPDILTDTSYGDAVTGDSTKGIEQLKSVIGLTGATDSDILNTWSTQLQTEFNEMITSVEKYKGFYIGRYETGNLAANTTTTPVVKRGQTAIGDVNWYYMYQNSKKIAGENSAVKSSMIWGCQWDRTMQWLVESGNKTYAQLKDSKDWGNYKNATFEYTDASGVEQTKAENTSTKIPTGSTEYTKANNIYDLAGNVYDWTIESIYTDSRVNRRRLLLRFRFSRSSF